MIEATKVLGKTLVASPERRQEADADLEIVRQVQAGDVAAFDRLITKYRERVYGIVYNMTSSREDAADLTQDAFIKAFQSIHRFGGQSSFFTWLYRITVNLCRDWIRRERRAPLVAVPEGVDPTDLADERASPIESVEDLVARREMSAAVAKVMAELPEEQRAAILLKEYHGLTFQEIADMLDCPLSTVKTRLYQGLSVLRRRLERRQAEEASLRRARWESTS